MAIKILGFPGSTYTLAVLMTLEELGVPYEFVEVDWTEIKSPEFLAKHPFGQVPVLIDDDFTLYESRPIAVYLAKKYQGTKKSTILYPTDDERKSALLDQYMSVEYSDYDPAIKIVARELIYTKFNGKTPVQENIEEGREAISKVLDVYDKLLEGKDYLAGDFSLVDIFHIPYSNYLIKLNNRDLWEDPKRPNVVRWWKSISNRESWIKLISEHEAKLLVK
ncbi:7469_t:CDS:2 [Funneliformis geosporum]|uniref:glutathione transferase n=1 Tax=Funneliformis geosporum TaxID=1117311 RepID=A0A9W4SC82_9GLOM|nr:16915_t:CDS:2 [Funneliformis geosporum]CAI2167785.1 7469_t:CDS:2 [Funneliformis geosporum]